MMLRPIDEISTETLVRDMPGGQTLVGELSEVGYPCPRRLFPDAYDTGIRVRSHRTGVVKTFVLEYARYSETDLMAWEFVEYPSPAAAPLRLVLLND